MNRFSISSPPATRIAAALVCIPLLAGCTPAIDFFGPRPDPALLTLAAQASATGHPDFSQQYVEEIGRLCGTHADGTIPNSCSVDLQAAQTAQGFEARFNVASLLEAAVPQESIPLIIDQAIALSQFEQGQPAAEPASISRAELADATELLTWEYQTLWSLDFAQAYVSEDERPALSALISRHAKATAVLRELINGTAPGSAPTSAAGYQGTEVSLPTNAETAHTFIASTEAAMKQKYAATAVAAHSAQLESDDPRSGTKWAAWLIEHAA